MAGRAEVGGMRRLAGLVAASALLVAPLALATPAHACAPPAEGEPNCCPAATLVEVTVADRTVRVSDPTNDPRYCA
jgi:hypothetical protein